MKIRVIKNKDNSVRVVHPAKASKKFNESESDWSSRVLTKATPAGAEYYDIDDTALPVERKDRGAWEWDGTKVVVNKQKAKQISKEKELKVLIEEEKEALAIASLKKAGKI